MTENPICCFVFFDHCLVAFHAFRAFDVIHKLLFTVLSHDRSENGKQNGLKPCMDHNRNRNRNRNILLINRCKYIVIIIWRTLTESCMHCWQGTKLALGCLQLVPWALDRTVAGKRHWHSIIAFTSFGLFMSRRILRRRGQRQFRKNNTLIW